MSGRDPFVLTEVNQERDRQDAKWGQQNHPDGTGPDARLVSHLHGGMRWVSRAGEAMSAARIECQEADEDGTVTWRHIMLEEVFEALSEHDPAKLRVELIQVAAVAVAWVEAIDRRNNGGA